MNKIAIKTLDELADREPAYALVARGRPRASFATTTTSRCFLRSLACTAGALMSDGHVEGENLICGVHDWDYRARHRRQRVQQRRTALRKLQSVGRVFRRRRLGRRRRDRRAGSVRPPAALRAAMSIWASTPTFTAPCRGAPRRADIQELCARRCSSKHRPPRPVVGHGRAAHRAAELGRHPVHHRAAGTASRTSMRRPVATELVIGPRAKKPLTLEIPLFVSDMSFGALSEEAKVSLLRSGAELAGTGICSGEGGMLPEEQAGQQPLLLRAMRRHASASPDGQARANVQAFHFKGGQGAKTGTGGHLPGAQGPRARSPRCVASPRKCSPAISPSRFPDWTDWPGQIRRLRRRGARGHRRHPHRLQALGPARREGHRRGARRRGRLHYPRRPRRRHRAAPNHFPRQHLGADDPGAGSRPPPSRRRDARRDVTLVITGGLRSPPTSSRRWPSAPTAVAISNAAIQAIGCSACAPATPTTARGHRDAERHLARATRSRSPPVASPTSSEASVELMKIMARACGHSHLKSARARRPRDLEGGHGAPSPASPTAGWAAERGRRRATCPSRTSVGLRDLGHGAEVGVA